MKTPETFNKLPSALVRSGTETVEITAANIFNNGFSSSYTGFDGVELFSELHPLLGGGNQANEPSTDADLSVSSLTAGLTAIEKYTDERGLKNPTKAVLLLVPVDLWNVAEELLGSEYKPYVANNEVNALQKKDLQYFVGHYLTDNVVVRYARESIDKITHICGKLLRALTTLKVKMLKIGQSAGKAIATLRDYTSDSQFIGMMI